MINKVNVLEDEYDVGQQVCLRWFISIEKVYIDGP